MKKNKLEDSLNKLFSNSGYKMVDVSEKNTSHRKALAAGEIILNSIEDDGTGNGLDLKVIEIYLILMKMIIIFHYLN